MLVLGIATPLVKLDSLRMCNAFGELFGMQCTRNFGSLVGNELVLVLEWCATPGAFERGKHVPAVEVLP